MRLRQPFLCSIDYICGAGNFFRFARRVQPGSGMERLRRWPCPTESGRLRGFRGFPEGCYTGIIFWSIRLLFLLADRCGMC